MKTLNRLALAGALACALLPVHAARAQEQTPAANAAPQMDAEQQAMMEAWEKAGAPGPEHKQLARHFAGTWTTKHTMWMDPAAPPMTETGKSTDIAVLDGRQIQTDYRMQFMGQPYHGMGTLGYDNTAGKYVSSWMDSMSTGLMVTQGDYDPATKTYTFSGEMADPTKDGAMTRVRETMRVVDDDHHVMEMFEPRDGKEVLSMRIEYTRVE